MIRAVLAAILLLAVTACGSSGSGPTCDTYSMADPIARKMMVSDELQRHGLDYARTDLHNAVMEAIARHCGPIDPYGHVKAPRNGDEPFTATVNWTGLNPQNL